VHNTLCPDAGCATVHGQDVFCPQTERTLHIVLSDDPAHAGIQRFYANLACPEKNAMGIVFLETFKHHKIHLADGTAYFQAGILLSHMNIEKRDLFVNRFSAELIDDGCAVLIKCPNIAYDYIHCSEKMADGARKVNIITGAVQEEMNPTKNALLKDKSRHDHVFILDFCNLHVNLEERSVPIQLKSFHKGILNDIKIKLAPEPFEFETDEQPDAYYDDESGEDVLLPPERLNLFYKLAIHEEYRCLITEGAPDDEIDGAKAYKNMQRERKNSAN
jgi:hypothetical protein